MKEQLIKLKKYHNYLIENCEKIENIIESLNSKVLSNHLLPIYKKLPIHKLIFFMISDKESEILLVLEKNADEMNDFYSYMDYVIQNKYRLIKELRQKKLMRINRTDSKEEFSEYKIQIKVI